MKQLKLFATLLLAIGGGSNALAQTDVTAQYLQNPGFEVSPIFDGSSLGTSKTNATATEGSTLVNSNPNVYKISGWTTMTTDVNDFARTFTMPYNTTLYVNGNKNAGGQAVSSPDNKSSQKTDNSSLLFVEANWCPNAVLGVKQTATLPKGIYKLTFDTYVSNSLANATSLCGIKYGTTSICKWPSVLNTWTDNEIIFSIDEETDVQFSMGYVKNKNVGGGSSAFMFADNVKLYKLSDTSLTTTDQTSKITNPNADNNTNGWTVTGTRSGKNGFDGKAGFFEPSSWGANDWDGYVKQTISNLPNGLYKVQVAVQSAANVMTWVIANENNSSLLPANETQKGTIASDGSVVAEGEGVAGWNYGSTTALVTDGTLTLGVQSRATAAQKWTNADNFTLYYYENSEVLVNQITLQAKINEAQALIDGGTYKGTDALQTVLNEAKTYLCSFDNDNVVAAIKKVVKTRENLEISNASIDKPANIEIANPDMATTDGWTGASDFSHPTNNENPGSNVTRPYFETWVAAPNTQSKAREFKQVVSNCPQGAYELKAAVTATYQVNARDINENNGVYLYIKDGDVVTKTPCKTGNNAQYFSVVINHESDGDLEIGLSIDASTGVNWIAFDNFSLQCYGIGNYEALAKKNYNAALDEAKNAVSDVVTGNEKTALDNAISANPTTAEDYITSTSALQLATINIKEANTYYQSLSDAKTLVQNELPYASKDKYTEFTTAKNATAESAADAVKKANDIIATRRAYVESNGKAEGVDGAVDCTDKIVNADFSDGINGWTSGPASDSEVRTLSNEPWTNADGSKGGAYFNYWNGSANNQHTWQDVAGLATGKYIVTVKARAINGFWMKLKINNEIATDIDAVGNTGGTFDRGWNDFTAEFTVSKTGTMRIEVGNYKPSGVDNKAGWFGFGDVRLYRIGDLDAVSLDEATNNTIEAGVAKVTLKRTLAANKWNTLVLPFDVADADAKTLFGDDVKIAKYSNSDDVNIKFNTDEEGIKANVPVLIKPTKVADDNTYVFDGATLVSATPTTEGSAFDFVGSYASSYQLENDEYMLYGDKWWKTEEGDTYKIKAFRAYIKAKTAQAAKSMNLVIDGQTTGLKLNTMTGNVEGETYNLAGQRVANSYKGIVVKNGKKMIKK